MECIQCIWTKEKGQKEECLDCNKVVKAGELYDKIVFGSIEKNFKE